MRPDGQGIPRQLCLHHRLEAVVPDEEENRLIKREAPVVLPSETDDAPAALSPPALPPPAHLPGTPKKTLSSGH